MLEILVGDLIQNGDRRGGGWYSVEARLVNTIVKGGGVSLSTRGEVQCKGFTTALALP